MKLRNTVLTDIKILQKIEHTAAQRFLTIPELTDLARSEVTDYQTHAESIADNLAWLVEDQHGIPQGFCYGKQLADSLYLAEISCHPSAQGQGLGRQLMTHVRRVAAERGMAGVTLTTYCDVPWNAPWYQRQGFITLEPVSLTVELRDIVQQQQEAGLMRLPRCAMWQPCSRRAKNNKTNVFGKTAD